MRTICENIDTNEERLLECTTALGYTCLNDDSLSRIGGLHEKSANLDLCFVSYNMTGNINCKQNLDTWGSDHYPITLEYVWNLPILKKKKQIDWASALIGDKFRAFLTNNAKKTNNNIGPNGEVKKEHQNFAERLYRTVNVTNGKTSEHHNSLKSKINKIRNSTRNPVKWWNMECQKVINNRKKKLKEYRNTGEKTAFVKYKESCAVAKLVITKKRGSFYTFCNNINRWTKYVWNNMKVLKIVSIELNRMYSNLPIEMR